MIGIGVRNMKIDKTQIVIFGLVAICLFLFIQGCDKQNKLDNFQTQIAKFEKGEQAFLEQIDKDGKRINEQSQVILTQKQALKQGLGYHFYGQNIEQIK